MDSISIFPSNSNNNDINRSRYPALRMWNTNPASNTKRRIVGIGEEMPEEAGLDLVQKYQRLCTKLGSHTRRTPRTPNRNRRRKSRVASPECWVLVSLLATRVQWRIGTTRVLYKLYFVVHRCCACYGWPHSVQSSHCLYWRWWLLYTKLLTCSSGWRWPWRVVAGAGVWWR